jgi:hypothetical protein
MATSETFRGHDQIRQLATRSVAARTHSGGTGSPSLPFVTTSAVTVWPVWREKSRAPCCTYPVRAKDHWWQLRATSSTRS